MKLAATTLLVFALAAPAVAADEYPPPHVDPIQVKPGTTHVDSPPCPLPEPLAPSLPLPPPAGGICGPPVPGCDFTTGLCVDVDVIAAVAAPDFPVRVTEDCRPRPIEPRYHAC